MRINHVVAHPPFREGTGTVCYYNASALRALGQDVLVYAAHYDALRPAEQAADFYHWVPARRIIGHAYWTPALRNMRLAEIIHLHYPFLFGAEWSAAFCRRHQRPLILTYHNDLRGSGIRRPAFWLYQRLSTPLLLAQARKVIVPSRDHALASPHLRRFLSHRGADLVEVPNGVDVARFRPDAGTLETARARYGLGKKDFVILHVSALDRPHVIKGLGFLLETLAGAAAHWRLLVVGDGELRAHYEAQARRLGLGQQVIFAGSLAHDAMPLGYAACDVVCIPAAVQESFGMALAEGMAMARPVIGGDFPGARSLVLDGQCGYLVPFGNRRLLRERLERLAADPRLRRQMGAAGRERILQHYTWERAAEALLAVYREVHHG